MADGTGSYLSSLALTILFWKVVVKKTPPPPPHVCPRLERLNWIEPPLLGHVSHIHQHPGQQCLVPAVSKPRQAALRMLLTQGGDSPDDR